jgi:hypothetical protein
MQDAINAILAIFDSIDSIDSLIFTGMYGFTGLWFNFAGSLFFSA